MKNAFKLGFLALALSLSVVACSEKKSETTTDSMGGDSTMTMTTDTMMTDSTVTDTTVKTTTETTKPVN